MNSCTFWRQSSRRQKETHFNVPPECSRRVEEWRTVLILSKSFCPLWDGEQRDGHVDKIFAGGLRVSGNDE